MTAPFVLASFILIELSDMLLGPMSGADCDHRRFRIMENETVNAF